MTQWFRWHQGTTEDAKFRVVARNARVTVRDAIAVWAFMLEDASNDKHRGICERGYEFISAVLYFEGDEVERVLAAMASLDMIEVKPDFIEILNWNKRQYESDLKDPTAAARMKRYRDGKKTRLKREGNASVTGSVTVPLHTETEAEAETEQKGSEAKASDASASPAQPFPPDHRTKLFRESLGMLASITGKTPDSCRSLIGRWLKDADDEAIHVIAAIEDAHRNRIGDPVGWINKRLKLQFGGGGHGRHDDSKSLLAAIKRQQVRLHTDGVDYQPQLDPILSLPAR